MLLRLWVVDAVEVGALLEGRAGNHFDFVRRNDDDQVIIGEISGREAEKGIVGGGYVIRGECKYAKAKYPYLTGRNGRFSRDPPQCYANG